MNTTFVRFVDLQIGDKVALPTALPGIRTITTVVDLETAYQSNGQRYRVQFSGGRYQYVTARDMVEMVVAGSLKVEA